MAEEFRIGDVVYARVPCYPKWPALLVRPSDVWPVPAIRPGSHVCKFFNDGDQFAVLGAANLRQYRLGDRPKSCSRHLVRAHEEADAYLLSAREPRLTTLPPAVPQGPLPFAKQWRSRSSSPPLTVAGTAASASARGSPRTDKGAAQAVKSSNAKSAVKTARAANAAGCASAHGSPRPEKDAVQAVKSSNAKSAVKTARAANAAGSPVAADALAAADAPAAADAAPAADAANAANAASAVNPTNLASAVNPTNASNAVDAADAADSTDATAMGKGDDTQSERARRPPAALKKARGEGAECEKQGARGQKQDGRDQRAETARGNEHYSEKLVSQKKKRSKSRSRDRGSKRTPSAEVSAATARPATHTDHRKRPEVDSQTAGASTGNSRPEYAEERPKEVQKATTRNLDSSAEAKVEVLEAHNVVIKKEAVHESELAWDEGRKVWCMPRDKARSVSPARSGPTPEDEGTTTESVDLKPDASPPIALNTTHQGGPPNTSSSSKEDVLAIVNDQKQVIRDLQLQLLVSRKETNSLSTRMEAMTDELRRLSAASRRAETRDSNGSVPPSTAKRPRDFRRTRKCIFEIDEDLSMAGRRTDTRDSGGSAPPSTAKRLRDFRKARKSIPEVDEDQFVARNSSKRWMAGHFEGSKSTSAAKMNSGLMAKPTPSKGQAFARGRHTSGSMRSESTGKNLTGARSFSKSSLRLAREDLSCDDADDTNAEASFSEHHTTKTKSHSCVDNTASSPYVDRVLNLRKKKRASPDANLRQARRTGNGDDASAAKRYRASSPVENTSLVNEATGNESRDEAFEAACGVLGATARLCVILSKNRRHGST